VEAPRFPKHVEEGWWLVLGDEEADELLALKRIRFSNRTTTKLSFQVCEDPGEMEITMFLMCDSYMGFDQMYTFNVHVRAPDQ
jgi:pre-mRNA-splicing helicase BRR2